MSEFKVGDRITGADYNGRTHTGAVVRVGPCDIAGSNEYLIRPDGGGTRYVRKGTAVAAEPEVRKGDRVRVTSVVEAVVTDVYGNGFQTEGPHYWDRRPDNETRTVQILERAKPDLRPGDVVVAVRGIYLIGERNVHYTSTGGDVIDAGMTPDGLAAWIASVPDGYIHIKHSDLKGFKA